VGVVCVNVSGNRWKLRVFVCARAFQCLQECGWEMEGITHTYVCVYSIICKRVGGNRWYVHMHCPCI